MRSFLLGHALSVSTECEWGKLARVGMGPRLTRRLSASVLEGRRRTAIQARGDFAKASWQCKQRRQVHKPEQDHETDSHDSPYLHCHEMRRSRRLVDQCAKR